MPNTVCLCVAHLHSFLHSVGFVCPDLDLCSTFVTNKRKEGKSAFLEAFGTSRATPPLPPSKIVALFSTQKRETSRVFFSYVFLCPISTSLASNRPSKFTDGWVDQLQIICLAVAAVVVNCLTSRVKIAHVTRRHWCGKKGTQKAESGG